MNLQNSTGVADPAIAFNLARVADYSTADPFIDMARVMGPFAGFVSEGWKAITVMKEAELRDAGIFDANGYPTRIPEELDGLRVIWASSFEPHQDYRSGIYTLTYDGTATVSIGGAERILSSEPGKIVFENADGSNMWLDIVQTDPAGTGDHIRNISLVHERHMELFEAGAVFNPDYLDVIADARELRFVDWMRAIGSDQTSWDERPEPTDIAWTEQGVPVEIMVQLANEVGADPWFTIPHLADDDYVRNFAEYVRDHLDPRLKVHAEFSVETWNSSFPQQQDLREMAIAEWGEDIAGDWSALSDWRAKRATEVALIWDDVFGDEADARVVNVLGTHAVNAEYSERILTAPTWAERDPGTYVAPASVFDALATTTYFGHGIVSDDTLRTELLDRIRDPRADAQAWLYDLLAKSSDYRNSIPATLEFLLEQKAVADAYGLDLVAYEGGQHVHESFGGTLPQAEKDTLLSFMTDFVRSDYMAELYDMLQEGWSRIGDGPFMQYNDVIKPGGFGSWGLLSHLGDTSPRAELLFDWMESGGSWWGEGGGPQYRQGLLIEGNERNEQLAGTPEEDYILARGGDDIIFPGPGNDFIHGGAGTDTVLLSGRAGDYTASLEGHIVVMSGPDGTDRLTDVERLRFSGGEEVAIEDLVGNIPAGDNDQPAGGGDDGPPGQQDPDPGAPEDTPFAGFVSLGARGEYIDASGSEGAKVTGAGQLVIEGINRYSPLGTELGLDGSGTDRSYVVFERGATAEIGGNTVKADYWTTQTSSAAGSVLDSALRLASVVKDTPAISGGAEADVLLGNRGADVFFGGNGDDWIDGRLGDDILFGGAGNDRLVGGRGNDSIDGGSGIDTALFSGVADDYTSWLDGDIFFIVGPDGTDRLRDVEYLRFSDGAEVAIGDLAGAPLVIDASWDAADEFFWISG